MAVFQAAIDESVEKGIFILGGCIATAEAWARFSNVWERMLPHFGTVRDDGRYHFKMREMSVNSERMARVEPFFRVIEDHALGFVASKIDEAELKQAIARIVVSGGADWGRYVNPWMISYRNLVDVFHVRRDEIRRIFGDEKIDFYFDKRAERTVITETWENYVDAQPASIRKYYGATPRFEDDMDFLPLQAADLWSWWVRKWYVEGTPEKVHACDFGTFTLRQPTKLFRATMTLDEEQLTSALIRIARTQTPVDRFITDTKTGKVY